MLLILIKSSAEAARVSHFLPSTTKDIWTGGFRARGGKRPWNGMWTWTDGSAFKYTNWRPGEPNHNLGVEYYIQISDVGGKNDWNDFPDRNHLPFVCKCRLLPISLFSKFLLKTKHPVAPKKATLGFQNMFSNQNK